MSEEKILYFEGPKARRSLADDILSLTNIISFLQDELNSHKRPHEINQQLDHHKSKLYATRTHLARLMIEDNIISFEHNGVLFSLKGKKDVRYNVPDDY